MKKSTLILTITAAACSVIGVVCMVAAVAKMPELADKYFQGDDFTWGEWDGEGCYWGVDKDASGDNVRVHLPFMDVVVTDGNVDVNMPGLDVSVDEDTGEVDVDYNDETAVTDTTDVTDTTETTDSGTATETTAK